MAVFDGFVLTNSEMSIISVQLKQGSITWPGFFFIGYHVNVSKIFKITSNLAHFVYVWVFTIPAVIYWEIKVTTILIHKLPLRPELG